MKKLFTLTIATLVAALWLVAQTPAVQVAGDWEMTMETPHGAVKGPLKLTQDGAKFTGTYDVEHMGAFTLTGAVDGKNITMKFEIPGADHPFGVTGQIDGAKMSGQTEMGGAWSAGRK